MDRVAGVHEGEGLDVVTGDSARSRGVPGFIPRRKRAVLARLQIP